MPDDASAPCSRCEGDVLAVPVLRKVVVKRLLLVQELRVSKQQRTADAPQTALFRHEHVTVGRLPPAACRLAVRLTYCSPAPLAPTCAGSRRRMAPPACPRSHSRKRTSS